MPVVKSASGRYNIINKCLSNKQQRYWTIPEIIKKMEDNDILVERRTIEADFETMRYNKSLGYNAPIQYCRTNKGYHYSDPAYTIDKLPLDEEDFKALNFAINIVQQYIGVSIVKQFEDAIDKVLKAGKQLKTDQVKNNYRVIAFEKVPYYKGLDHFDKIHQAIRDQQPLTITYRKFSSEKDSIHTFHPYFLKEYKDRWYVLGYSKERHFTLPLALDRIELVADATVPFKPNKTINPDTYFQHTLGITLGRGPVEEIRLWFSPQQGAYIRTRHIHSSQQTITDDADGLIITLQLIPNYELIQEILSYGTEVKVIGPSKLKSKIREVLVKASGLYDG